MGKSLFNKEVFLYFELIQKYPSIIYNVKRIDPKIIFEI